MSVAGAGERLARIVLGVVTGCLLALPFLVDLPADSSGRFWSDGATYYAMAWSLAEDLDLRYEAHDLERIRSVYPGGPQGLFLKRSAEGGLYYAKAMLYPAAAAPAVRLLGADRGLLLTNAAFLSFALWLGHAELRRRLPPLAALATALVLFLGTVTPLYLLWLTPEVVNLGLVTAGLVAWRAGRPLLSAVLLGLATYAKPTNLLLALPLGLEPLVVAGPAAGGLVRGLRESMRRGAVLAAVVLLGFGLTWSLSGEVNYQGGERKTFYDRYPLEAPGVSFDTVGIWMTTDHVGPLVAGRDEDKQSARVAPARPPEELRQSYLWNLLYFWVGRFGGAVPYFSPVVLAAALFLLVGPRERAGWLALAALVASWLFYIWLIPDNWYGGGGAVGNRYFVNLVPLGLLLVPARGGWWVAGGGAVAGGVLVAPLLLAPVRHSLNPGEHATWRTFRAFPAELTMLGDLSVFTDVWRKRRPYYHPEAERRGPDDPAPYYLWFLDDGTYGQETSYDEEGFWMRGGRDAEVVLQALAAPSRIRLRVTAGPAGDILSVRLGRTRERLVLRALETRAVTLAPGPGLGYYRTRVYRLRFDSRYGAPTEQDRRSLGSFVRLRLE
ncbi:MAG TPA: hypothetical protein VLI67_08775 [Vicinamibacteria bacterium]|nr:hypothetical protein [Vicinamibacteria bacterium]